MRKKREIEREECFCGSVTLSAVLLCVHTLRAAAKLNSGSSVPLPNLQLTSPPEPNRTEEEKKLSLQKPSDRVPFVNLTSVTFVFYTLSATLQGTEKC